MKEESKKVGLKLNIQKTKIMASGPITSGEIHGETVETVSDYFFWGLSWGAQPGPYIKYQYFILYTLTQRALCYS